MFIYEIQPTGGLVYVEYQICNADIVECAAKTSGLDLAHLFTIHHALEHYDFEKHIPSMY